MTDERITKMVGLVYYKYKDLLEDPGTPDKVKDIIRVLGAIKDGKPVMIKEEKGNDGKQND